MKQTWKRINPSTFAEEYRVPMALFAAVFLIVWLVGQF